MRANDEHTGRSQRVVMNDLIIIHSHISQSRVYECAPSCKRHSTLCRDGRDDVDDDDDNTLSVCECCLIIYAHGYTVDSLEFRKQSS